MRQLNALDNFISQIDQCIRTLSGIHTGTHRPNPSDQQPEQNLSDKDIKKCESLMRINHTGEICAQALYQGQALTARKQATKHAMRQAALEENDHLLWCQQRLQELNSHTSYLNPLWWLGSFSIGVCAGILGDKWSLGFVAETENQVTSHLERHLNRLPTEDRKSYSILEQMAIDEKQHEVHAYENGAAKLPTPIPMMMRAASKVMTTTVYYV